MIGGASLVVAAAGDKAFLEDVILPRAAAAGALLTVRSRCMSGAVIER